MKIILDDERMNEWFYDDDADKFRSIYPNIKNYRSEREKRNKQAEITYGKLYIHAHQRDSRYTPPISERRELYFLHKGNGDCANFQMWYNGVYYNDDFMGGCHDERIDDYPGLDCYIECEVIFEKISKASRFSKYKTKKVVHVGTLYKNIRSFLVLAFNIRQKGVFVKMEKETRMKILFSIESDFQNFRWYMR